MNDPRHDPLRSVADPAAAGPSPEPAAGAAELEELLAGVLPSLRQLERDLELDGVPAADLVGESEGRLVLVLWIDGEGDAPALAALDALATARNEGPLLARHLGLPAAAQREPLVVLVAERYEPTLRRRLEALPAGQLLLLELRTLRTGRRHGRVLVPLPAPERGDRGIRAPEDVAARFLSGLSPSMASLGSELIGRIGRIDAELALEGGRESLSWSFRGQPLCTLVGRDGRLEGRLPGSAVPHGIHSRGGVDTFLEWVLTCYLELLDDSRPDGLEKVELIPSPREALLTPEEIEAFRS